AAQAVHHGGGVRARAVGAEAHRVVAGGGGRGQARSRRGRRRLAGRGRGRLRRARGRRGGRGVRLRSGRRGHGGRGSGRLLERHRRRGRGQRQRGRGGRGAGGLGQVGGILGGERVDRGAGAGLGGGQAAIVAQQGTLARGRGDDQRQVAGDVVARGSPRHVQREVGHAAGGRGALHQHRQEDHGQRDEYRRA